MGVALAFQSHDDRSRLSLARDWSRVLLRAVDMLNGDGDDAELRAFACAASELEVPGVDPEGVLYRIVGVMSVWASLDAVARSLSRVHMSELVHAGYCVISNALADRREALAS